MSHIPSLILRTIAWKVILGPFSKVVPNATQLLLENCRNEEHKALLYDLGLHLGIDVWIDNLKQTISSPRSHTDLPDLPDLPDLKPYTATTPLSISIFSVFPFFSILRNFQLTFTSSKKAKPLTGLIFTN